MLRISLQPCGSRRWTFGPFIQDLVHHLIFNIDSENELLEKVRCIRAFARPASARQRINFRAAIVRAEIIITTRQIFNIELGVHRMRRPSQEDHPLLVPVSTINLRKHSLFARFYDLPAIELELLVFDNFLNVLIGRGARLNAINFFTKFVGVSREICKVLHAVFGDIIWYSQSKLCAFKVLDQYFSSLGAIEVIAELLLRWHPVAKEHIGVASFKGLITNGHRHRFHVGLIAQTVEQYAGDGIC